MNSQRNKVFKICKGKKWRTLFDIKQEIYDKYGDLYLETAISARLRDYSKPRDGYIKQKMRKPSSKNTWYYRIVKA